MKAALKNLLKKWFPTVHPLPAKRLARWEKEMESKKDEIEQYHPPVENYNPRNENRFADLSSFYLFSLFGRSASCFFR
ncbi:hypothetical protein [Photorhabdus stackebrandtii]|uniref:Uncharacterized protein n=1 Tax=Photorhabdus stackebrandtii TaxID=1123042 RepID=A0A7X5TKK7_9GAMM|nr:hypothetical protein [Photorhabdus stackebrandtii]NHB97066.1 hypothetical protein [Photorhabdus stackebrandtii]